MSTVDSPVKSQNRRFESIDQAKEEEFESTSPSIRRVTTDKDGVIAVIRGQWRQVLDKEKDNNFKFRMMEEVNWYGSGFQMGYLYKTTRFQKRLTWPRGRGGLSGHRICRLHTGQLEVL